MAYARSACVAKVTLRVVGMTQSTAGDFFQRWRHREGIEFLQIEWKKQRILVHYDALLISLTDIVSGLQKANMSLNRGIFYRWRLHLAKQVEQNIRDNINHIPHCCGKAPRPIQGKK
ncbi:hypothetical protein [Marinomonas arenicola]|uniref:Transposase n=1 Tax=Marinomonas arenicola TaxID=569601 RepID=A0ABU9G5I0_9GAMM